MQYEEKTSIEDARQYDGDAALIVVHDQLGQQTARKGDWLVGSERGKIRVFSDADFHAKFVAYSPTADADELKAAQAQVSDLSAQVASLQSELASAKSAGEQSTAALEVANAKASDRDALASQVADLTTKLADAEAKAADEQQKLQSIIDSLKTAHDEQSKLNAAQNAVNKVLGLQ